jgi:hypothetical protein
VTAADERFLVVTEHGRVLVVVRGDKDGLDPDLIEVLGDADTDDVRLETPLRAFAAKMVDLVQARGEGAAALSPAMASIMVKEKAAEDLRRIERAARRLREQRRGDADT